MDLIYDYQKDCEYLPSDTIKTNFHISGGEIILGYATIVYRFLCAPLMQIALFACIFSSWSGRRAHCRKFSGSIKCIVVVNQGCVCLIKQHHDKEPRALSVLLPPKQNKARRRKLIKSAARRNK